MLLIHGTDTYLSQNFLHTKIHEYTDKNYEVKILNADDEFEVSDASFLISELNEQDLFGTMKLIVIKRISSSELFFKNGKALKTSVNLMNALKSSRNEIILWEDKLATKTNPLGSIANDQKIFVAPAKEYEITAYINANFAEINPEIRKILSKNIKTTNTIEIATELEKLSQMPLSLINDENIVLSKNIPIWSIGDSITSFLLAKTGVNFQKMIDTFNIFDEDIRFKLAIIQNHIGDIIFTKRLKKNPSIREKIFGGRRSFIPQMINRYADKVDMNYVITLYEKSLFVEYLLNKGTISENVALEYIFTEDIRSMNLELL